MGSSDFIKREAYRIRKFLKLVLMSGSELPYALALRLIKMPFVLILQDRGGALGLLFSDGRYAYFITEDSVCCKPPQSEAVQFVAVVRVPPLNASCLLLDFFREQLIFLFM